MNKFLKYNQQPTYQPVDDARVQQASADGAQPHLYKPVKTVNFYVGSERVVLDQNQMIEGRPTPHFKDGHRLIEFYFNHNGQPKKKILSKKYFRDASSLGSSSADGGGQVNIVEPLSPSLDKKIRALLTLTGISIGIYLAYKKQTSIMGYFGYGFMGMVGGSLVGWVASRNIATVLTPTASFQRE